MNARRSRRAHQAIATLRAEGLEPPRKARRLAAFRQLQAEVAAGRARARWPHHHPPVGEGIGELHPRAKGVPSLGPWSAWTHPSILTVHRELAAAALRATRRRARRKPTSHPTEEAA